MKQQKNMDLRILQVLKEEIIELMLQKKQLEEQKV
jgi:hypothetical protein